MDSLLMLMFLLGGLQLIILTVLVFYKCALWVWSIGELLRQSPQSSGSSTILYVFSLWFFFSPAFDVHLSVVLNFVRYLWHALLGVVEFASCEDQQIHYELRIHCFCVICLICKLLLLLNLMAPSAAYQAILWPSQTSCTTRSACLWRVTIKAWPLNFVYKQAIWREI